MIKVFIAKYYDSWNFGGEEEVNCIVTANTESEALGLVVDKFITLPAEKWDIQEVDTSTLSVEEL